MREEESSAPHLAGAAGLEQDLESGCVLVSLAGVSCRARPLLVDICKTRQEGIVAFFRIWPVTVKKILGASLS